MIPTDNCPKMFIQMLRHLRETDETVPLLTGHVALLEPRHLREIDKNILLLAHE